MEIQSKPGRKTGLSPENEALSAEVIANPAVWIEKFSILAARLKSSPVEEQEVFFGRLLSKAEKEIFPLFQTLIGIDEGLDTAMARGFAHGNFPEAGDFLTRWAGRKPSKVIAKEIRRSLFRLKSKGVPVKDLEDSDPGVFRPPQIPAAEGYVSTVDAGGSRLVWIGRPQQPHGMIVMHAAISDTEGIRDFTAFESTRKKFRELLEQMRRDFLWDIVEADPVYLDALIHEAHEIQVQKGKTPHPEYLKWKVLLGPSPALPIRPLIYRYLNEEEIKARSDLLDRSPFLFQTPAFQSWYLEKEEAAKCLALLEDAARSPIILAPYQREGRFFEIYRQTVREIFDGKRRLLFRRRLEEMAYVLWKKGDESGAKISVAGALGLAGEDRLLTPHPFLTELVKRTVMALQEEAKKEKEKGKGTGLIVQP